MQLSSEMLSCFFHHNPIPQLIIHAETGSILQANDAACTYYGLEAFAEYGRSLHEFDTNHPAVIIAELNLAAKGIEQTIVSIHRTIAGMREVRIDTSVAGSGPDTVILATIHDITEQAARERTIVADEERWRSALCGSGDGVWDWDISSDEISCSLRWKEMLGYSAVDMGNDIREWLQLVCDEEREQVVTAYEKILAGGCNRMEMEYRMRRKDGSHVWILDRCVVLRLDTDGRPGRIISIHSDITARKQIEAKLRSFNESLEREVQERTAALNLELKVREETEQRLRAYQEQLAALTEELCRAEEQEQRRLAAWLHDEIGQNLALLKILFDRMGERTPHKRGQSEQIADLLASTIKEIREHTTQISPPLLQKLGLVPSISKLANDLGQAHGFSAVIEEHRPLPILPMPLRSTLFSIIKELLVNIVKHAGASLVSVAFDLDGDSMTIIIRDNGAGFDVERLESAVHQNSFGLFHVRQRIGLLGGTFRMESAAGQGSSCLLRIPLKLCAEQC